MCKKRRLRRSDACQFRNDNSIQFELNGIRNFWTTFTQNYWSLDKPLFIDSLGGNSDARSGSIVSSVLGYDLIV
jgi:hypothetical protein